MAQPVEAGASAGYIITCAIPCSSSLSCHVRYMYTERHTATKAALILARKRDTIRRLQTVTVVRILGSH